MDFLQILLINSLWDARRRRWSDRANTVWAIMAANQTNRETISSSFHLPSTEQQTMMEIEILKHKIKTLKKRKKSDEATKRLEELDQDGGCIRSPRWKRVWHHQDASDANYPLNLWILICNHPTTASKIPPSSNKKRIKRRKKLQHRCGEKASGSSCDGHANPRTKPQPEN